MGISEHSRFGLQLSTLCTLLTLFLTSLYAIFTLSISLTCRLYLKAFYATAHQMALAFIICCLIFTHHIGKLRYWLSLHLRPFSFLQSILNFTFLVVSIATAIGYGVLTSKSKHTNYDNIASTIGACVNVAMLCYLTGLTVAGYKTATSTSPVNLDDHPTTVFELQETSRDNYRDKLLHGQRAAHGMRKWSRGQCCRWCFRALYIVIIVILLLVFTLTTYNVICTCIEMDKFQEDSNLVTVHVEGYEPIALYTKCAGKGTETIVFENGLGGTVFMMWNFLPRLLSEKYRVCCYDRRGYGWSETFENDHPLTYVAKPQRAYTNIQFLYSLVEKLKIKTPFYYAGHSYGSHHLTYMALEHPEVIKGLIYLDGAQFSPVQTLRALMEIVANIQHSGLLRAAIDVGIINYRKLYSDIIDFTNLPVDLEQQFIASLKSGYFFATYVREKIPLVDTSLARDEIQRDLKNSVIHVPVLLIDAGNGQNHTWFPKEHFPQYYEAYHVVVSGATHETLVMSMKFAPPVADLIATFIQAHN